MPLNTGYTVRELAYFLDDAAPAVFICDPLNMGSMRDVCEQCQVHHVFTLDEAGNGSLFEKVNQIDKNFVDINHSPDLVATILYTSGTTGQPKGAMLTHQNMITNARALNEVWGWQQQDVLLHVLPIFHVHGLFIASHCVLSAGSTMYFLNKPSIDQIIDHFDKCTVMMGVPTHYTRLLSSERLNKNQCRPLRLFASGSAPLTEKTFYRFAERTGHKIVERYGMSETIINSSNPVFGERKTGSVGFPLPGIEMRIIKDEGQVAGHQEVGMLQIRGPNVFKGY